MRSSFALAHSALSIQNAVICVGMEPMGSTVPAASRRLAKRPKVRGSADFSAVAMGTVCGIRCSICTGSALDGIGIGRALDDIGSALDGIALHDIGSALEGIALHDIGSALDGIIGMALDGITLHDIGSAFDGIIGMALDGITLHDIGSAFDGTVFLLERTTFRGLAGWLREPRRRHGMASILVMSAVTDQRCVPGPPEFGWRLKHGFIERLWRIQFFHHTAPACW